MEITPKTMEIEYIRIKRLNQGREEVYAAGLDAICCYYKPLPMYESYIIKGDTLYPVLKNGKSLIEYLYAIAKPGPELGLYNRGIYFGPKKDK